MEEGGANALQRQNTQSKVTANTARLHSFSYILWSEKTRKYFLRQNLPCNNSLIFSQNWSAFTIFFVGELLPYHKGKSFYEGV